MVASARCGALLLAESGNREMPPTWEHDRNCVFYDEENLESLLEHYLSHEEERAAIAARGRQTALDHPFEQGWDQVWSPYNLPGNEQSIVVPLGSVQTEDVKQLKWVIVCEGVEVS